LFGVTPAPTIVTVADLELVPVFAEVAVTVIVPLFVPDTGDSLSHVALSVMVHVVFDVILKVPVDPEAGSIVILVGDTFKYSAAACVTVTVLLVTPEPAIVTVADLELVPVFAEVAVQVIVPLFDPLTGETVSQLALSVILQVVLEVMANVPDDPEAEPSEILVGDTFKYFAAPVLTSIEYSPLLVALT
jgi:hypothetical protein